MAGTTEISTGRPGMDAGPDEWRRWLDHLLTLPQDHPVVEKSIVRARGMVRHLELVATGEEFMPRSLICEAAPGPWAGAGAWLHYLDWLFEMPQDDGSVISEVDSARRWIARIEAEPGQSRSIIP